MFKNILSRSVVCLVAASGVSFVNTRQSALLESKHELKTENFKFPSRDKLLEQLKSNEPFDILIIGGGATGAGVAYEATKKGLRVALVDRSDYSSGTSSKSTKLIHGGIRYLQKAILSLDYNEYILVKEALHERSLLLETCPHRVTKIPILLPIYGYFDGLKMYIGLKLYDFIAWQPDLSSYYVSKRKVAELFPFLKLERLKCGFVYYDAQQDDSRMNLSVIKTAISKGVVACNYVEVEKLIKSGNTITGVVMKDKLTNTSFECQAKCVVNATGPFTDSVRKLADPHTKEICYPSSGVHLALPPNLCQNNMGILIYEADNRVLFVLPWQGITLVGTTDVKSPVLDKPIPSKDDISYILNHFNEIIQPDKSVSLKDVASCWSGLRPLVVDLAKSKGKDLSSAQMTRSHLIESHDNFITIAGGKWTTFRKMGEDVVDEVVTIIGADTAKNNSVKTKPSLSLFDGEGWSDSYHIKLEKTYNLPSDLAVYLSRTYGTCSDEIATLIQQGKSSKIGETTLHKDFPYTEEEIIYICRNEYVCKLEDIVSRRLRLSFINSEVALSLLPRIAEIAAKELNWSSGQKEEEIKAAKLCIQTEMGHLITAES